jgi:tripartite ATP-independent transporter DctP family solute receptor
VSDKEVQSVRPELVEGLVLKPVHPSTSSGRTVQQGGHPRLLAVSVGGTLRKNGGPKGHVFRAKFRTRRRFLDSLALEIHYERRQGMGKKGLVLGVMAVALLLLAGMEVRAAEISMRTAEIFREGFTHSECQKYFAKRVGEITKGKADVKVFLGATLGNERNYCEQLQMGSLDFGKVAATNAVAFVPKFAVFGMPYLIKDLDHLYKIFDSPAGKILQDAAEKAGFVILAYWDMNTQSIYNSRKPIMKPDDLKGLKIRTREAPVCIEGLNAMGASAAPLATPELYTALQTKVFDGADHDPSIFVAFNFGEVCKFYSLTEHSIEPCILLASKKLFDKYPKDVQDAVRQAGRESMAECRKIGPVKLKEALDTMQSKYSVKINKVDKEPFIKAVAPVQAKYKGELGADLVDGIAKLVK